MLQSRRFRTLLLFATMVLWACSSDDSGSNGPPDSEEGLPDFPAGDAQVSPDVRTEIADLITDLGANAGASSDPELAGVLGTIGSVIIADGHVTGVTASSALRAGNVSASLAEGTWGVFAVTVGVYPADGSPVSAYYTAIIALNGTEAAIGIKKANTVAEIQDANAEFPDPKAQGLLFQGRSRGWGAIAGYTQVIEKSLESSCTVSLPGVSCLLGKASAGLEIDASAPLPFSGNTATGTRTFALPYGDVRSYHIEVYCHEATLC